MKEIARNDYYAIEVDESKNRVYLTITGFWRDQSDVPHFLDDMKEAAQHVSSGFTVLTDVTKMKTPPPAIGEIHVQAQQIFVQAGLDKTAEILPQAAISNIALGRYAKKSGMEKGSFATPEEAEAWLDE